MHAVAAIATTPVLTAHQRSQLYVKALATPAAEVVQAAIDAYRAGELMLMTTDLEACNGIKRTTRQRLTVWAGDTELFSAEMHPAVATEYACNIIAGIERALGISLCSGTSRLSVGTDGCVTSWKSWSTCQ